MHRIQLALEKKDKLKRAEEISRLIETEDNTEVSLVPVEYNNPLLENILSTKILSECETYFIQESTPVETRRIEEHNNRIDQMLEMLEIQLDTHLTPQPIEQSPNDLEETIKYILE
ncbi:hypothetical protein NEOKW01_0823 [Nematocida sp. AWRm80]|nr:hypothetical protein NEOKW01_0823 [Nematocida sp. AWRm80]